jgi:hypothetical protein
MGKNPKNLEKDMFEIAICQILAAFLGVEIHSAPVGTSKPFLQGNSTLFTQITNAKTNEHTITANNCKIVNSSALVLATLLLINAKPKPNFKYISLLELLSAKNLIKDSSIISKTPPPKQTEKNREDHRTSFSGSITT